MWQKRSIMQKCKRRDVIKEEMANQANARNFHFGLLNALALVVIGH